MENRNTNELGNHSDYRTFEKCLKGDRMFIGGYDNNLFDYSVKKNRMLRRFGKICNSSRGYSRIFSMTISIDNKTLFLCLGNGGLREFTIRTHKETNHFGIEQADYCLVTYDNKYLIIVESGKDPKFLKYSIETKKLVNTWHSNIAENLSS